MFEVEGESMIPTLMEGDIVICQAFSKVEHIMEGTLALLVTENGVYIKRVERSQNKKTLLLESYNHNDFFRIQEISKESILQAMAVKGKICTGIIPYHQLASKGKIQNLEESIEFIKKELFMMNKKMTLLGK